MTKIRDIIQINSGYTSYVDLYEDYYDLVKNRGRMERYKPIAAHRQAFATIANALNPLDRRFYFLSGSYGTGKSHLLLMLANYFASPSDVPELERFFQNYEAAQDEILLKPGEFLTERKAASLKEARKSGRFLVALCRYSLNLDFEGAVLRALEDALQKDESTILLDTHYREALRRLNDWQTRRHEARFFNEFELALSTSFPDWTVNDVVEGLETLNEQALKVFKQCFHVVTDSDFAYKKDNLRDIITDFLKSPEFKENYKGIVILYDEFGAAIDSGLVNYTTLLDFAQFCASSTLEKGGTVLFVGAGHKAFRNHGKIGDLNAETLAARVTDFGLQTQGMEDIIGAIVQPKNDSPEWNQQVQSQTAKFTWFSSECNRLHLFNWLPAPKIKNNIIQSIYPMHPLATYALLRLAGEAGSDNRSVVRFFAPEFDTGEQGWTNAPLYSYPWFLENHEILEQGKLALYTADLLVDYFQDSLRATNTRLVDDVKNAVVNYEATQRELKVYLARKSEGQLFDEADALMLRIIKVMLVHEIISNKESPVANTAQNIEFALDAVSPEEKTRVEDRLKLLSDAGVLYNNKGVYELMRGDRKDIQRLIEHFKANPDNRPTNLLESFLAFSPLKNNETYLDARGYNEAYNEDKRLKVQFATPVMLTETHVVSGETLSYFAALEQERGQVSSAANGYEGSAVYVFCENDAEIDAAKKAVSHNDQQRVVVAIPRLPISVYDALFTLKALESEWFKKQAQSFDPYEKAEEKDIRDAAIEALNEAKNAYFSNAKVYWFEVKGKEIPAQQDKRRDAAYWMMQSLYGAKRNTFPHTEFNKTHINLSGNTRAIFEEAGDILCDLTQSMRINWALPDNRGGTRYLRKCFVDQQVLRVLSLEGDYRYLEAEKDLGKFRTKLPAYARLLEDLGALEGKGQVNFGQFVWPIFEDYGQGDIAVTLMLLLARRFYGDSLRFKREPNNLTDMTFSSTRDMLDLVQGKAPSAVILFEPVSAEDQAYFAKVTQTFTDQPAPAGKVYSVAEAYQALTSWWDNLPVIARSLGFYDKENKPLADALSQAKLKDPFHFVKHDVLELLGQGAGEVLSAAKLMPIEVRLKGFKTAAETVQSRVEERVLHEFAQVFEADSHLDVDIQEAMKNWYHGLSLTQKDTAGSYHNNDSKPLVMFTSYANIRELLFVILPEAYSLGRISTWMSDFTGTYMQRVRNGKAHIETHAPQISPLKVTFENETGSKGNQVTHKGELVLHADTEDGQGVIYYTEDGTDPTYSQQRQKLQPGQTLTISGNRKVKLIVADEKGHYGAAQTYEVLNELEKYVIKRSTQQAAFNETITFVFPPDKDIAQVTLLSFIKTLSESGYYTAEELKQAIQNALDSLSS